MFIFFINDLFHVILSHEINTYIAYSSDSVNVGGVSKGGRRLGGRMSAVTDANDTILALAYADEFEFFCRVNSFEGCTSLQSAFDALFIWCGVNLFHLNVLCVAYTRKKSYILNNYTMDGIVLTRV